MTALRHKTGLMTEIKCLKKFIFFICAEISLNTKDIYQSFLLGAYHGKTMYHTLPQDNRTVAGSHHLLLFPESPTACLPWSQTPRH